MRLNHCTTAQIEIGGKEPAGASPDVPRRFPNAQAQNSTPKPGGRTPLYHPFQHVSCWNMTSTRPADRPKAAPPVVDFGGAN